MLPVETPHEGLKIKYPEREVHRPGTAGGIPGVVCGMDGEVHVTELATPVRGLGVVLLLM